MKLWTKIIKSMGTYLISEVEIMQDKEKSKILKELQQIPSVGKSISEDLWELGIRSVKDLSGQDPEDLYKKHSILKGRPVDKCVLYSFRCAVYYASNEVHDPELLKWWNWKFKEG